MCGVLERTVFSCMISDSGGYVPDSCPVITGGASSVLEWWPISGPGASCSDAIPAASLLAIAARGAMGEKTASSARRRVGVEGRA